MTLGGRHSFLTHSNVQLASDTRHPNANVRQRTVTQLKVFAKFIQDEQVATYTILLLSDPDSKVFPNVRSDFPGSVLPVSRISDPASDPARTDCRTTSIASEPRTGHHRSDCRPQQPINPHGLFGQDATLLLGVGISTFSQQNTYPLPGVSSANRHEAQSTFTFNRYLFKSASCHS